MSTDTSIEALLAYAGKLSEAAQRSDAASVLQHRFVNGGAEEVVQTESGPLPTLAKWRADTNKVFEDVRVIVDTNFRRLPADPGARSDGSPLEIGDEYFNTVALVKRSWNGAIWFTPNADGQAIQQALADPSDPNKGAGMVGMEGRWLRDYLKQQEYYLTIEYFGPVDTPASTAATMQLAINFCAENNILLRGKSSEYIVDLSSMSITIPNNFRCDLNGAWVRRATGNATPHDMWVNADMVNGNTGLDIRSVRFEGLAQVDHLTNGIIEHRFCGLRLVNCSGKLVDVRADSTCNAEIQAEGVRGGILLENSVFMECHNLRADATLGTGLIIYGGRGSLSGFAGNNNTGSGMSGEQPGWQMDTLRSVGSGYSGISINGVGAVASGIYASGAPVGYAGVNIGHAGAAAGTNVMVSDVYAENNAGWGINATSSSGLQGKNWFSKNSGNTGIRLINCPGAKVSLATEGGASHGVLIDGTGNYSIDARISGALFNGLYARNGADVTLSEGSLITGNAVAGGLLAGITTDTGARVELRGKVLDNLAYGVQSTGGGVISLNGGTVKGSAAANVRTSEGTVTCASAKFSDDAMSGTFTVLAGSNTVTVLNRNIFDPNRIVITPANAAARAAGIPFIGTYALWVSFTAQIGSAPSTDCVYRWAMI